MPYLYRTISAFGWDGPDTLNPNGIPIILAPRAKGPSVPSCGTGPLQGALSHKSIFAVKLSGALPQTPVTVKGFAFDLGPGPRPEACRRILPL